MEDNQSVITEVPTATEYSSAAVYGEYGAMNPEGSMYSTASSGDNVHSGAQETAIYHADGLHYADVSAYNKDPTSSTEATADTAYLATQAHIVATSTEIAAGYENANGGTNVMASTASTGMTDNGSVPSEMEAIADPQYEMSSEEDRLWGLVRANCLDFNSWTSLIQETEKENNILKIRKVYDAFLAEFPLCFGYWKKYADHEAQLDTMDKVVDVYERAVLAVTYSVDIWVHYCQFAISTHGDPENIRRLFERGLAYVGTDYLSSPLWDEYINYEYTLQEWSRVAMIYTRILECPIQQLDRYFSSFREFAASRPLADIRLPEEAAVGTIEATAEDEIDGEVRTDGGEQSHKSVSEGLTEAEELEKYIAVREEIYRKAKEFDSKIVHFETAIRRPYFHVKPLDDPELENWHYYLDFIEKGDDFNKVVKLYERCLIACANYTEFWIRYVLCMEASGSMELATNALARATQVFVKKQPDIHLFAARFKELSGDVLGARAEYQILYSEFSTALLEAAVRHANMEYRLGNKEVAFSVFEEAIAAELGREFSTVLPLMFVQYSRFSFLVAGDAEKAREILTGAFERIHLSRPLLEAAIHLESVLPVPKRIEYLDSLVEKFITPVPDNPHVASTADREDVSCIFLEFLDIFGDAPAIKKADNRHSILFLRQRGNTSSRKRRSDDYLGSEKMKVPKHYATDPSTGQPMMGAYPNTQTQWSAGYSQHPPAWPHVPQTPAQQWNPGYAPQGGYTGYGSYGSYPTNPQMPTSAPQTAAYGAYPATSSVQAYPPQSYAQPAPAYTQQPAPVGQAYYGSYY